MKRIFALIILALLSGLFLFLGATTIYSKSIPQYDGYVNDFADVLTADQEILLENKFSEYDKQTTNQVVVVTIKSLEGDDLEEFSIKLAEEWKPGQKDKDNGVIMLFAMEDRKMRIEVGRGLEGDLTDIESKHIIDGIIVPEFKNQKYFDGINKGSDTVISIISGQDAIVVSDNQDEGGSEWIVTIIVVIIAFIIILVASSPYTPIGGQGTWGITSAYSWKDDDDDGVSGHSFGDFFSSGSSSSGGGISLGGGSFSGGGASGSW